MDVSARRAVETRRLYQFERIFLSPSDFPYTSAPRSMPFLTAFARRVWAEHGRKGAPVPSISFSETSPYSYCQGFGKIVLKTSGDFGHNCIEVLLHELVHAMGYRTHGRGFVRKYVEMLVTYGRCDEGKLRLALTLFGVKH